MMNPSTYGPQPPNAQPPPLIKPTDLPQQHLQLQHQQQQQQQQSFQSGSSSQGLLQSQSNSLSGFNANIPSPPPSTTNSTQTQIFAQGQGQAQERPNNIINGNYQQQLTQSMNAMNISNSAKQPINMSINPIQQQQHQQHHVSMDSSQASLTLSNNTLNNTNKSDVTPPISNSNSGPYMPPPTSAASTASVNSYVNGPPLPPTARATLNNNYGNYTNGPGAPPRPPAVNNVSMPLAQSITAATIPGQQQLQQMTINSASIPGLPHMPPPPQQPPTAPLTQMTQQSAFQSEFSSNQYANQSGQYLTQQAQQQPHQIPGRPIMPPMPGQIPPYRTQDLPQQQISSYAPQSTQQQPTMPAYPTQMMPPPQQQQMAGRQSNGNFMSPPGTSGHMYSHYPNDHPQPQYPQPPVAPKQKPLDPEQMPNPIQVMIENQSYAGGAFVTNQAGLLPPLVTTKYVVQDQGNTSPRFARSSLYCIPSNMDLLKMAPMPFSLIVSPFARLAEGEFEPPIVDFGTIGPIRCNRCKAYMSPNMQFVDAGRRFQCLMCKVTTEVPTEYFQYLDHTGQRVDKYERPELVLGTYEFLATKDYCRNNIAPEVPAFIFVIDVSYNTMKSGLVHLLCSHIKRILKHLPVDQGQTASKMRVGFITFNSTVHFYNIKSNLGQPQMMIVGDVQDMFMPLLDGFLANPDESEAVIDALLEQIPKMFLDTKETECVLYPAIQAGLEALKASNAVGKLFVFNSTLPIADAPGKLKNRDDRKLLGTDKEKSVLIPQCQSYNQLGQECVQHGCSVDLFIFNNSYIDIATIGQVARLTGGEVYKYTYFQAEVDGKRLVEDLIKNISRPIAFDAVMRVRSSAGIRATDFYGHYFISNTTDIELASVDCNKALAIEIKYDDKLPPEEHAYLQIALLYTSCSGQRRLRIFNLALQVTSTIADVFKHCDLDAMVLFFAKQACFKLMDLTPKVVKDNLVHRSAQILAAYRKHCTAPTSAGQLILPENLKLLPLYISCLIKNDAISGGSDMTLDDRSYVIHFILAMDLNVSVSHLYPRFIPIHNLETFDMNNENDDDTIPLPLRCTYNKMAENGAYILENGVHFFIWLGQSLPNTFIQSLFGVQCTAQVNADRFAITGDTPLANRLRSIIEKIMKERTRYMKITCVRQNDKLESVFRHFLVEDRGTDGSSSYVDFLCHMHKEIKELLS